MISVVFEKNIRLMGQHHETNRSTSETNRYSYFRTFPNLIFMPLYRHAVVACSISSVTVHTNLIASMPCTTSQVFIYIMKSYLVEK